jgi:hypothetical protein
MKFCTGINHPRIYDNLHSVNISQCRWNITKVVMLWICICFPTGTQRHFLPPTGTQRRFLPPTGTQRHFLPPTGTQRRFLPPTGTQRRFLPPTGTQRRFLPRYKWNIVESSVKHHNSKPNNVVLTLKMWRLSINIEITLCVCLDYCTSYTRVTMG